MPSTLPFIKSFRQRWALFPVPPGARAMLLVQPQALVQVLTPVPVPLGSSVASYSSSFGSCTCDLSIWREGEELFLEIQELYSKNDIYVPQRMYNGVEILASKPLKSWQNSHHRHFHWALVMGADPGLWAHSGDSIEMRPRAGVFGSAPWDKA